MRKFIDVFEARPWRLHTEGGLAQGTADTVGDGYWSDVAMENIKIKIEPKEPFMVGTDGEIFGHLRAYFDKRQWDVDKHGLIYTDSLFEKGVKNLLKAKGFTYYDDINYSEQGMQGYDYVDFDCGDNLSAELNDNNLIKVDWGEDD